MSGGIGMGGKYDWEDRKYQIYGEKRFDKRMKNFGDRNVIEGYVGMRVSWQKKERI